MSEDRIYNGPRTHHLHIVESSDFPDDQVVFRDYLRANRQEALAYLKLKEELARDYSDDREAYTNAKTAFISAILVKAHKRTTV